MTAEAMTAAAMPNPRAGLKFLYPTGSRPLAGYTIKRGIGRGGFGEVYFAVSDAGKEVALKLIRRNLEVELRGISQCLNFKHPNLLALYDVKVDAQDNTWLVMEYIAGESLEDVLRRHPQGLPPAEACEWMRGIAAGAAYLHNHGIVHRDLKPGNIFRDEGLVKIGDYGLSKFISCSLRSGQTDSVGTVHYMAPEVANGRYGKQIDIYALGIILFEMLTGRVPFEGESVGEVLMKHLTATPDLSALAEPYRSIVAGALEKDPDKRFASIEEFAARLPSTAAASEFGANAFATSPGMAAPAATVTTNSAVDVAASATAPQAAPAADRRGRKAPKCGPARNVIGQTEAWWNGPSMGTGGRIIMTLAAIAILLSKTQLPPWLAIGLPIMAGSMLSQRCGRKWRNAGAKRGDYPQGMPNFATANTGSPAAPATISPLKIISPAETAPMRRGPNGRVWTPAAPRQRLAELLGSLLLSAGFASAISGILLSWRGKPIQPEQFAWLAIVSTLGAWSVLILSKCWEGLSADPLWRRLVQGCLGLGVGAAACALKHWLIVELPFDGRWQKWLGEGHAPISSRNLYASDGSPLLSAYLIYFGLLFLLIRWWRQADPLRKSRFSFIATASSLLVVWVLNVLWPFPQPWVLMAAVTISLAVQLASPWARPARRGWESA